MKRFAGARLFGRLFVVVGLAAALGLGLAACSDEPADDGGQGVAGKTPVVSPEDVNGRKGGRAEALSPDYRQAMTAGLENGQAASAPGQAASKTTAPTASAPDVGRLFADRPGPPVPPPGATPLVAPPAAPAPQAVASPAIAAGQAPALSPAPIVPPGAMPAMAAVAPALPAPGAPNSAGFPEADCRQLVLVTTADARAPKGMLRRLTRSAPGAPWAEAGPAVPCALGRNGLGGGRGLGQPLAGPAKRQGDGRTPAGLFRLPAAFGYAASEAAAASGVRLPYTAVTDRVACVTEAGSPLFGRVVGPDERPEGGLRQDRMMRDDNANAWGVVIGHNTGAVDPEGGTCLFINVRPAGGPPTGGSVGIPAEAAATLVAWLDPGSNPLLAVLPESDLRAFRSSWGLP